LPPQREHLSRRIALSPLNHRLRAPVLAALSKLPGGDALCHGDFHPGNVLLADSGPSIIDWFDAVSGDPAADIARTLLLLQYSRAPSDGALESVRSELTALYLHEYRRLREVSSDALQAWALPVATARLAEPIAGQERTTLLRLIEGMLASQSQPPSAETAGGSGPL
jgi:aminoglycoside phosphotransferase (APT) family kinase protein